MKDEALWTEEIILHPYISKAFPSFARYNEKRKKALPMEMNSLKEMIAGQFSLALGALFYTFWWLSAFKPGANTGWTGGISGILLLLLAISGLGGVGITIMGICELPLPSSWPGGGLLSLMALAAYLILLLISTKIFGRIPTTELILIAGWALLEIMALGTLSEAGLLSGRFLTAAAFLIAAATFFAFISYMVYYRIDEETAYILGALPLLADGAVCAFLGMTAAAHI